MSARGELVLISLLTDFDSLDTLAVEGLPLEAVPSADLRRITEWALGYYYDSGRRLAPTREAMLATWGEKLSDNEVELLDPDGEDIDTMDWAIEDLRGDYARSSVQTFVRELAMATGSDAAHSLDLPGVIHEHAARLLDLDLSLASHHAVVPVGPGLEDRISAYERRVEEGTSVRGITFGYPAIDNHTHGLHPGEIGIIAAGAKAGKSMVLCDIAKNCWQAGRRDVLFTLENSKEMTLDRIACFGAHVDPYRFEHGSITAEELERVRDFRKSMGDDVFVVEPAEDERTPMALYRQAQLLGATGMIVDQLTWVHHPDPGRKARTEVVGEILRGFLAQIRGNDPIPLLMAHQINRDGIHAAKKTGRLEMTHMAESAEVERACAWAWGLYQSEDDKIAQRMKFLTLAARRAPIKHWNMAWKLNNGMISTINELTL